jgi:hypothetical protein
LPLLTIAHDSGYWRIAKPYQIKGFHLQSSADLSRRAACPLLVHKGFFNHFVSAPGIQLIALFGGIWWVSKVMLLVDA